MAVSALRGQLGGNIFLDTDAGKRDDGFRHGNRHCTNRADSHQHYCGRYSVLQLLSGVCQCIWRQLSSTTELPSRTLTRVAREAWITLGFFTPRSVRTIRSRILSSPDALPRRLLV